MNATLLTKHLTHYITFVVLKRWSLVALEKWMWCSCSLLIPEVIGSWLITVLAVLVLILVACHVVVQLGGAAVLVQRWRKKKKHKKNPKIFTFWYTHIWPFNIFIYTEHLFSTSTLLYSSWFEDQILMWTAEFSCGYPLAVSVGCIPVVGSGYRCEDSYI